MSTGTNLSDYSIQNGGTVDTWLGTPASSGSIAGSRKLVRCTAANIPSAVAGYATGCILMASDTGVLYTNTGTTSSCTFTAVDSSTSLVLPSAFTDGTTTTGVSFDLAETSQTSGTSIRATVATANFTTGGAIFKGDMTAATAGNGLVIVTTGAYTGTGLATLTAGAMTTGVVLQVTSTTGLTSGSLIRATTSTAGALATNGAVSITGTGAYTSTSNVGLLDVLASATTAGTVVHIRSSAAGQTTAQLLNVTASGYTTGYTGNVVQITGASTTGAGNVVALIGANTTAGTVLTVTGNTVTTSAGGAATVTANALTTGSAVAITSSSTDTGAYRLLKISNTGTQAASTAIPLEVLNTGTNTASTKFSAIAKFGGYTIWVSTDGTTANGTLSGTAGDVCLNGGGSGKMAYCTGTTSWSTLT